MSTITVTISVDDTVHSEVSMTRPKLTHRGMESVATQAMTWISEGLANTVSREAGDTSPVFPPPAS